MGKKAKKEAKRLSKALRIVRQYDGALSGPRRQGFGGRGTSANVEVGGALRSLRDRARSMVRNTPHGHAIVDVMVRHVVGSGITPVWNTGSDRSDRQVGLIWEGWARRSDAAGELDFCAQQDLMVRSMVEGGESLMRFVDLRYVEDPLTPMRLQLLEGDHIDGSRDGRVIDGHRTRLGVGLGDWDRRTGYWLFEDHPGEQISSWTAANYTSRFVDRDQIIHVYRPLRIGQLRGVSWLAPVLLSSKDLAELLQNTIVKSGVEAAFSGFIIDNGGGPANMGEAVDLATGDTTMMPEPGMLMRLRGQDIRFAEPKTSTQFEPVAISTLMAMAAGTGHTYDQITGDLRQANYSSLNAGKIEHRRLVEQVQWHHVIPRLDRVAERFVDRAIMAGSLRARADGYPRDWVPPAHEPIDRMKDMDSDVAAVRAGRMPPQEFISQWGRDWKKVVQDSKAFWKFCDENGIVLDIDPRRPAKGGAPAKPAPPKTSSTEDPPSDGEDDAEDTEESGT